MTKEWKTHLEEELAPGLTEGQLGVLELLLQLQPMKPSDLLVFLATTPAAITTLLDRMERGGLVVRNRDKNDRRIVWVTVTEKGEAETSAALPFEKPYINGALRSYLLS